MPGKDARTTQGRPPPQGTRRQRRTTEQAHCAPASATASGGRQGTATTLSSAAGAEQRPRQSAARPALPAPHPPAPPSSSGSTQGPALFPPTKARCPPSAALLHRRPAALPVAKRGGAAAADSEIGEGGARAAAPATAQARIVAAQRRGTSPRGTAQPAPGDRRLPPVNGGNPRRSPSPSSSSIAHYDRRCRCPRRCCGNAATARPANNRRSHWPGGAGGRALTAPQAPPLRPTRGSRSEQAVPVAVRPRPARSVFLRQPGSRSAHRPAKPSFSPSLVRPDGSRSP